MKYAIIIIVATAIFTILGLIAAWGACEFYTSDSPNESASMFIFMMFTSGGLIAGLVVGCLASYVGNRLSDNQMGQSN